MAASVGSVKCLQILFENGADLNAPGNDGTTPGMTSVDFLTDPLLDFRYFEMTQKC